MSNIKLRIGSKISHEIGVGVVLGFLNSSERHPLVQFKNSTDPLLHNGYDYSLVDHVGNDIEVDIEDDNCYYISPHSGFKVLDY